MDRSPASVRDDLRCVVADDHPAIVDAVSRYLEGEQGVELVGCARDGEQALALIEELRPDVAVVDVRMPRMSGIDVVRRVSASAAETAVVLYTGYAGRSSVLEALDAGARGYIVKEAPLDELLHALRVVAAGEIYIDPSLARELTGPQAAERLPLTKREREILRLLADGMRNEQVAERLSISPLTVRTHVRKAMDKLEADTRTQAVASALRQSLIR